MDISSLLFFRPAKVMDRRVSGKAPRCAMGLCRRTRRRRQVSERVKQLAHQQPDQLAQVSNRQIPSQEVRVWVSQAAQGALVDSDALAVARVLPAAAVSAVLAVAQALPAAAVSAVRVAVQALPAAAVVGL